MVRSLKGVYSKGGLLPFQFRSYHTLRYLRLSSLAYVILIVSHASGCGSSAVNLPAGTPALLLDRDAPRVLADVPPEQRAIAKRRSLAIVKGTPVAVLEDPAYRALSRNSTRFGTPNDPVRVRVTDGIHQGIEVNVRRQDLTFPNGPDQNLPAFLAIAFVILIASAATICCFETLALALKRRRKVNRTEIMFEAGSTSSNQILIPRRTNRITDRGDSECDQWLAWVAAMTARRKLRCGKQFASAHSIKK
jgi:hypothetical protein